jgi:DeoR/GlpR family transcriptional regulator of sugar metabolism
MTVSETTPLAIERQRMILDILGREGVVRTAELCELLNVSAVTIRSDLRDLERLGELEMVWGGAVSRAPASDSELRLDQQQQLHSVTKKRIGERAARLIEEGQTIFLDAGTTTIEIVNHLPRNFDYLRVVTPALNVAVATTHYPYIELVMPGGVLRQLTRSLVGSQTLRALEMFNADWVFLASRGYDLKHGVTTGNMMEVEVKRTMVQQASKVVLVADSSKYGRNLSLNVAPLSKIDVLVTDTLMSDSDAQAIEAHGVTVLRV